tara:strand:+ start:4761 stop:5438 length:678 start_codon:yes stop_codon:yes gene_type:complete
MFASLFYTKETRNLIAELRKKNRLNEIALRNLNEHIFFKIIGHLLLSAFFILFFCIAFYRNEAHDFFVFCVMVFLFLLFLSFALFDLIIKLPRNIKLYNKGIYISGICENFSYEGRYGILCRIKYRYSVNNQKFYKNSGRLPLGKFKIKYSKGDEVDIFYDPKNPKNSVPFLISLFPIYYLSKEPRPEIGQLTTPIIRKDELFSQKNLSKLHDLWQKTLLFIKGL